MTGERDLARDREDPVPVVGALGGGRLHERRLGQPGLAGERRHLLVVEIVRVAHHRERVALQRLLGENVDDRVWACAPVAHPRPATSR